MTFAALHFGEHNLSAGIQVDDDEEQYERMSREVTQSFYVAIFPRRYDVWTYISEPPPIPFAHCFSDQNARF